MVVYHCLRLQSIKMREVGHLIRFTVLPDCENNALSPSSSAPSPLIHQVLRYLVSSFTLSSLRFFSGVVKSFIVSIPSIDETEDFDADSQYFQDLVVCFVVCRSSDLLDLGSQRSRPFIPTSYYKT